MVPRLLDPEIEKSFQERPKAEREVLAGTISHITHVLLEGTPADIVALEGNLRRGQELRSDSVDEPEARNKLRVFARFRGIEERWLRAAGEVRSQSPEARAIAQGEEAIGGEAADTPRDLLSTLAGRRRG